MVSPQHSFADHRSNLLRLAVSSIAVLLSTGGIFWIVRSQQTDSVMTLESPSSVVVGVGALGRLEPGWKVLRVGPASGPDGARVEYLHAVEGEWVEAGRVVAELDTRGRREAALLEARARVKVAAAKLALTRAGAKREDISAQMAAVEHLRASLDKAEAEYRRMADLWESRAASADEYDQRRFQLQLAKASLRQGEAALAALKVVRGEDVALAEAELNQAEAGATRAEADLEAARLRAPVAGRVLKIHARPGEPVGNDGVFELGDTAQMHAVAEVYERDVPQVRVGQPTKVWVQSLAGELTGEVVHVGWLVGRRVVLDNDPISDTDARVVEVRVRLDQASSLRVAGMSNARVEVRIQTSEAE